MPLWSPKLARRDPNRPLAAEERLFFCREVEFAASESIILELLDDSGLCPETSEVHKKTGQSLVK